MFAQGSNFQYNDYCIYHIEGRTKSIGLSPRRLFRTLQACSGSWLLSLSRY
jgi:hypothetical protein